MKHLVNLVPLETTPGQKPSPTGTTFRATRRRERGLIARRVARYATPEEIATFEQKAAEEAAKAEAAKKKTTKKTSKKKSQ